MINHIYAHNYVYNYIYIYVCTHIYIISITPRGYMTSICEWGLNDGLARNGLTVDHIALSSLKFCSYSNILRHLL